MYCGWPRNDVRLERASITWLSWAVENRYVFQLLRHAVLHHYNGSLWTEWNRQLRDYLISTQSKMGMSGSWHFTDKHGQPAALVHNRHVPDDSGSLLPPYADLRREDVARVLMCV